MNDQVRQLTNYMGHPVRVTENCQIGLWIRRGVV